MRWKLSNVSVRQVIRDYHVKIALLDTNGLLVLIWEFAFHDVQHLRLLVVRPEFHNNNPNMKDVVRANQTLLVSLVRKIQYQYFLGPTCNSCAPNTFNLSPRNPSGCNRCWCAGVTPVCESSSYRRSKVEIDYVRGAQDHVEISTDDVRSPFRQDI